jgi:hypothetical protein
MASGVTDFFTGTAGSNFGVSSRTGLLTFWSAACTLLMRAGRSATGTELLLTNAETISAANSMYLLWGVADEI